MRYTLLLNYPEMEAEGKLDDSEIAEAQAAFSTYAAELDAAGLLIFAEVLQPTSATTTVRHDGEKFRVQDGPFADLKERLGGTFVIEVPDLDAAIAWAQKAPSVMWGPIEVRPSALHWGDGAWTM